MHTRDEVRAWVIEQFRRGNISTPLYGAASAPAVPPGYDSSRVGRAVDQVRTIFDDGTASQSEVLSTARLAAELKPAERKAWINLLAREQSGDGTLLQRWLGEVTTRGPGALAGLDAKERRALFAALVLGQDGANLERIFRSVVNHYQADRGAPRYQDEFAAAVAVRGNGLQKLDLIRRLRDDAAAGDLAAARTVGTLIGSLTDPGQIKHALQLLDRRGMDAVVAASLSVRSAGVTTNMFGGNTARVDVDGTRYEALAQAVARSGNAREKGGFVAASGALLKLVSGLDVGKAGVAAAGTVAAGMSKVIGSDVNGVIENAMLQNTREGASSGREALKRYALMLVETGRGAHLGAITVSLQRGNDLKQDPMQFLSARLVRSGEAPSFVHARVMGDWLGIMRSALQSRIVSHDQAIAVSAMVFSGSADTFKELGSAAFPAFRLPISVGSALSKQAVMSSLLAFRNELTRADLDFGRALYEGALPRHPNGVEATGDWVTTMNAQFSAILLRQ